MIYCKALNKKFDSKEEMIKELVENKADIISVKKAAIKMSDGVSCTIGNDIRKGSGSKGVLKIGDIISNAINTTNYLDSHDDVHLPGIWNKSAKEQNGKTYHVADHELRIGQVVGYPKDVSIRLENMPWKALGYNYEGETQALIFDTKITDKTNNDIFLAYRDNDPVQHSIRMEYVDINLAVDNEEYKEEYLLFKETLPLIANRAKAEKQGYFFVVKEAKISKEGSTVLFGSNDITPYLGFTPASEPAKATRKQEPINFVEMCKQIKFNIH